MKYDEKYFSKSSNKKAMVMWLILGLALSVAYLSELLKGTRTFNYYIQFLLFCWGPFIIGLTIVKIKGMDTSIYKSIVAYGYGAFYTFVLFTTTSPLAFSYLLPLTSILILYKNRNYMLRCGASNLLVLGINIAMKVYNGNNSSSDIMQYIIQVVCLILCYSGYILSIIHINSSDGAMLGSVKENLDKVINTVETVKTASNEIVDGMSAVRELADENIVGANTVVSGMTNLTNNNIILQQSTSSSFNLTETISTQMQNVATMISQTVELATESTSHAKDSSGELSEVVRLSNEVEEVLHEFTNQFKSMTSEINNIEGITMQTNILSLNASVEAARAGASGKGFAVVAGEIRELSAKTKNSSDSIFSALQHLKTTSNKMTESITKTLEKVKQVNQSVGKITLDTTQMGENIKVIDNAVTEVTNSNVKLVDNMHDVSNVVVLMTESINVSEETTKAMLKKNIETTKNVAEVEVTVGKLMEELGVIGVMGLKDIKAGQLASISVKNNEYRAKIVEVLSDGVIIEFLQELESSQNTRCNLNTAVDNSYYKWDNVELTTVKHNGKQSWKIILTNQPHIVNRRKYERVPLNNDASVTISDSNYVCNGKMVNISAGGYAFQTNDPKIADTKNKIVKLSISNFIPLNENELDAKVIRIGGDSEHSNIGCRFLQDNTSVLTYFNKARKR